VTEITGFGEIFLHASKPNFIAAILGVYMELKTYQYSIAHLQMF